MTPDPARTRVTRHIAADPSSTALLLAGPAAIDLWPGVRRVGEAAGRTLVETELAQDTAPTPASVRTLPPQRTPTSFVTRFDWSGPEVAPTTRVLTLAYAPAPDGRLATFAALQLDSEPPLDVRRLRGLAEKFLANLSRAAEARSQAA